MANYSDIDSIAAALQALPNSQAYLDQFDDSVRGEQLNYGEPTQTYNYQDVQTAAQQIASSGQQLTQGNKVYDTGNRAINEALYGADIANNIGTDGTTGFRTPRQYDVGPGDYIKAGLEGVIKSYMFSAIGAPLIGKFGDALANTILPPDPYFANLATQAGELGSNAGEIVNTGSGIRDAATIVGGIFGADYDIPEIRPSDIQGGGGLYDMAVLDRVSGPELTNDSSDGGGGGGEPAAGPGERGMDSGQQPPIGGAQVPEEIGEEDDQWVWNGNVLVNTTTGEVRQVPNPGRLEQGVIYNGDGDPIGDEDMVDGVGDLLADDVSDIVDPNWQPSIDITQNETATPGVNLPGAGNAVGGSVLVDTGTGSGTSGDGTGSNGSGNGTDGTGDGDGGDGSGEGNGIPGMSSGVAGASTGANSSQFEYSTISPSQAAQLSGMIDYVAALRGGR